MLCVEVEIKPSKIHGYGVFAKHNIPKGTIIWETKNGFDRKFDKKFYNTLNEIQKEFVKRTFLSCHKYLYAYCDYSILHNHSFDSNLITINETHAVALKNIKAGEEITQNYDDGSFFV